MWGGGRRGWGWGARLRWDKDLLWSQAHSGSQLPAGQGKAPQLRVWSYWSGGLGPDWAGLAVTLS